MTTTDPNSDYDTRSTDLFSFLPQPYQSDTNRSVYSNLFNRFFSKTETTHAVGYIGQGNLQAVVPRQLKEPTVHRQAYQLQPILYEKIGSVEHMASWYDILNGLSAQGVDVSRQADWASALEFNWVPPIDINKIVNYRDYYWYDPANPQSQPQYITVKSECSAAMALVSFYTALIAQNGATFNIVGVTPADRSIVILGNFASLFAPGFVFYVENTFNTDLNNSFQQTVSSSFDATLNQTTIVISNSFTNPTAGGDVSLEQQLAIYQGIATCKCSGQAGWDILPWDDNQLNQPPPIWDATVIVDIAWPTLAAWNAAHGSPQQYDIWWDTTNDILYALENVSASNVITSWKPIYFNFSIIEQQTMGTGYWDLESGCSDTAVITGLDQWISQNRWVHKADITNFSIAKQAQVPIIEFEPNLELSEWITTSYVWQYRASKQVQFATTPATPTRLELERLNIYSYTTSTISLDERFGDLTDIFVPGYVFLIKGINQEYTVASSVFQRTSLPLGAFQTVITVVGTLPALNPAVNYLYPELTSQGDPFTTYGDQWLYIGLGTTQAINHQPEQNMMTPSVAGPTYPTYTTTLAPYAEQFDITAPGVTTLNFDNFIGPGSSRPLTERSLVGTNDVRVYKNSIRQYGNYDELGTTYVTGVQFLDPLQTLDQVIIQVGEATYQDFGNYAVPVRVVADDTEFTALGTQLVSLVKLRKNEQVKTAINQYPLFDIYNTDSTSTNTATPIFGYHEDSSGVLYTFIGQRIVQAADGSIEFTNYLVNGKDGPLYAYRNYNKSVDLYWYNTNTKQVFVWTGETWSPKYETPTGIWLAPLVQSTLPQSPTLGLLVYNTSTNTLNQWNGSLWVNTPLNISTSDETLETNWRHGTHNEQFVPQQVDWQQRSYATYTDQYNRYITTTAAELIQADPTLTQPEADAEANTMWTQIQDRYIVPAWYTDTTTPLAVRQGPLWIGNWQIPDPLYFNVDHEDWQYISATDLLTHFLTIVQAQPSFPGFGGQASANWRLIDYTQVNWGLGGTIKEYDNSFDTFLSSQFIDSVTPPSLFGFAQSEYENIIVLLRDLLTRNFSVYMTNIDSAVILDPGTYAADQVLLQYEENEQANLVYGDSTTFTQGTLTTPATGVQNWIATLPFFGIIPKVLPYIFEDPKLGIFGVMHHDGHRQTYVIPRTIVVGLQQAIINTLDSRAPGEKFGRVSNLQPPSTQANFITQFSSVLRNGVYWLNGPTFYRLQVASVGTTAPLSSVPMDALWWDTTGSGSLKQQQTTPGNWVVVLSGALYNNVSVETSTISAWQPVNLNDIFLDVILNAETKLYEEVPPAPITPPLDFAALQASDPTLYDQYLKQQFTNYTIELQIATPFANNTYNASNPFTWNYKYSTVLTPPHVGTIPSGGAWQDVYEKAYGTTYPHLEPWVLQGYTDKPLWWDSVYLNNDEPTFGIRRWKYIHGIPVVTAAPTQILVAGDLTKAFTGFNKFTVFFADNVTKSVFTVVSVAFAAGITTITVVEPTAGVTSGALIAVGMWDYILRGAIPAGNAAPTQTPPVYGYTSVNISNQTFIDGPLLFSPDDLFPPYWNQSAHFSFPIAEINLPVRSLFDNTSELELENADYLWGDAGPIEWQWKQTTNYLYSLVTVAYLLEPIRTVQHIFGTKFEFIDGLPIDSMTGKVFSHENTQFHGEISIDNQIVSVNGINQWYVNFNRANGYDTSASDFRALWTGWTAPLTYQFSAFIDTSSLSVQHRIVAITPSDYNITMKRSPGVSNYWIDALSVRVVNVPPDYNLYDTQNEWILELDSQAPVSRTVSYYDVKLYDFYVNPMTSICSLFTYPVVQASSTQNTFVVDGDVSQVFGLPNGAAQLQVAGSNAGTYTVKTATFDDVAKQTTIVTVENVPSNAPSGLLAAVNYRTLPWNTGDLVAVSSTQLLPLPLDPTLQYFVIKLSSTTFQLAYSQLDVTANIPILFTSQAMGIQRVGELYNTFQALNGANAKPTWYHYTVDSTIIKQLTLPASMSGIQNFVNIVDGLASYDKQLGFGINVDGSYTDPATQQPVSWQNELERFIDWAYTQRSVRRQRINDKYPVELDYSTGKFTFTSQNPGYLTGSQVVMWSFAGGLPPPFLIGQTYFAINNSDGTISLASNYTNAIGGIAIAPSFIGGVGNLYLSDAQLYAAELPTYELNPFRNALWFSPPYGILSNIIVGPFADVYSTQLIFDQYGRRLTPSDVRVFRQDKITQIQFASGVYNDIDTIQNNQQNPYQYLHIGGANLYIDTYEHVMRFNDYTTAGALIYDPFLGLNVTKFELDFYKQDSFTERPNVGGYFLSQPFNQGADLDRNIEGSLEDLRYMYDPYKIPETLPAVVRARALLGYKGVSNYLSQINLTPKSQFLFWKGMIHNKGSLNAITAFVNSRRFINAQVDEFWAYKVADFGPVKIPEYLSMFLTINDTKTNDLRLEFILTDQICLPGYAEETFGNTDCGYANPPSAAVVDNNVDPTFNAISMTDETRWFNQPDQIEQLVPDGGVLYFDLKVKQKLVVYPITLNTTGNGFNPYDTTQLTDTTSPLYLTNLTDEVAAIAYDPTNSILNPSAGGFPAEQQHYYTFWVYDSASGTFNYGGGWDPPTTLPILRHDWKADMVVATMNWYPDGAETTYVIPSSPANTTQLTLTLPYLPLTNSLSVFKNGVQLQVGVDFVESLELFPGSTVLGYKLYFADTISGSTVKVVYGPSQLSQDTQFQIVNTNILNLLSQEFVSNIFLNNTFITLWGLETDKEALNPAKIIDTVAQTVLTPVTYWDPARGYHYYEALNSIDIQSDSDPAEYSLQDGGLSTVWKSPTVGKTWLDTTNVQYLPYYDTEVLSVAEDRFTDWGVLTDFGAYHVYEWTASPVPPDQYNALAAVQQGDNTIDASVRLSGTARQDVRYRNRFSVSATVTSVPNSQLTLATVPPSFGVGSSVIFSSIGTLPGGLQTKTPYIVASLTVGGVITLTGVTLTDVGTGTITMSGFPTTWNLAVQQLVDLDASIDATFTLVGLIYTIANNTIINSFGGGAGPYTFDVYINGKLIQSSYTLAIGANLVFPTVSGPTTIFPSLNRQDRVTLVIPIHQPTATELAFDPTVADTGTVQTQYQFITNYVATQQFDTTTNTSAFTYYFWVENKTTATGARESIGEAASDLITPPAPYMFFGKLIAPALVANTETGETIQEPWRFSQAIVRGLRGYVDDENRYVLRFTRDFTLRDNLNFGTSPLQLKDAHQEWLMFREQQLSNVPLDLWNKITESMAGYLLSDTAVRVPSLNRELYDEANGTSTQYGLGIGQAFVSGPTAIATITAYLTDPNNNFYPQDMDLFFATFNFDTTANCVATMNEIYNTFNYVHVNKMFFSVLLDALSFQKQYGGIMKTSAVALYGIELLDVQGAFDD